MSYWTANQYLTKWMCNSVLNKCPNLQRFKMPGFYTKDGQNGTYSEHWVIDFFILNFNFILFEKIKYIVMVIVMVNYWPPPPIW